MKATSISAYNTKAIERLLTSITPTEEGFLHTIEEAQEFIAEEESSEAVQVDEDDALDSFSNAVSDVRDLAEELLTLKSLKTDLSVFRKDLQTLRDLFNDQPELNQASALQALESTYSSLKKQWKKADLDEDHPLQEELDTGRKLLTRLSAEVATHKDKTAPAPPALSTSFCCRDTVTGP